MNEPNFPEAATAGLLLLLVFLMGYAVTTLRTQILRLRRNVDSLDGRMDGLRNEVRSKHRAALDSIQATDQTVDELLEVTGGVWETALGTRLQIRDMTDTHIANAIEWCRQNGEKNSDTSILLRRERAWRRYNAKMAGRKTTPARDPQNPIPTPVVIGEFVEAPSEHRTRLVQWDEVDRVLDNLIARAGLTGFKGGFKGDLHKLRHLLDRGHMKNHGRKA